MGRHGEWAFLGSLLDAVQLQSPLVGRLWLVVMLIFRILVLATVGGAVFEDEQEEFVCNTLQPGCRQTCYDRAFPVSHYRFWLFHILLLSAPPVLFVVYSMHRAGKEAGGAEAAAQCAPGLPEAQCAPCALAMGEWAFLGSLLDAVQLQSPLVGRLWLVVMLIFRILVLATVGGAGGSGRGKANRKLLPPELSWDLPWRETRCGDGPRAASHLPRESSQNTRFRPSLPFGPLPSSSRALEELLPMQPIPLLCLPSRLPSTFTSHCSFAQSSRCFLQPSPPLVNAPPPFVVTWEENRHLEGKGFPGSRHPETELGACCFPRESISPAGWRCSLPFHGT
ncbi:PREDICTED: gap junction delta-3 protein [Rhinopithecus bieti]|uniref:gap junction delta-3 protein n=1 Tax=Rhinopithecus bieti TaxID=61621 RepID=UPI00083C7C29|nr:PREDICTED: gap junction delta-3 protein [Rhinopithecus bieti]